MTIYVTILEKTRFLESNTIYEQHKLYNLDKNKTRKIYNVAILPSRYNKHIVERGFKYQKC
jgi:hypothetical protein